MTEVLISWLVLSAVFLVTAMVVPEVKIGSLKSAIIVAAIFGVLSHVLGHVIYVLIGVSTLGLGFLLKTLTRWLVVAVLLKITDLVTTHLTVKKVRTALIAALVISVTSAVAEEILARI